MLDRCDLEKFAIHQSSSSTLANPESCDLDSTATMRSTATTSKHEIKIISKFERNVIRLSKVNDLSDHGLLQLLFSYTFTLSLNSVSKIFNWPFQLLR